ncbi:hypothetical protein K431DRAFT_43881 [Polychaeton citri CBS 116435]|uniref:Uncharacterized protein n=1 Tax=Polychaeton citri CBS 116435 TaxID=1314669 RepID=A0A9P4UJM5_9PEZI|nr:hypothetical protein K431DRAFT_43881 [Polychaeton citri CBS 116435]
MLQILSRREGETDFGRYFDNQRLHHIVSTAITAGNAGCSSGSDSMYLAQMRTSADTRAGPHLCPAIDLADVYARTSL